MLLGHGVKRLKKLSTHSRKNFQSSPFWGDLIPTRFSFYTLIRVLLVLVLFLANLMRKARNILSPMHPKTTRMRATTIPTKGSVLLLYGSSYISSPIFMAPSSLCTDYQPIKWLMTNDKLISKLARWALIFQEYEFKVIHRPSITHQYADTMSQRSFTTSEDSQKPSKILTKFQQHMYLMHLIF